MVNVSNSILAKFESEIDKDGNLFFDKEITKKLFSKGIKKVEVQIVNSSKKVLESDNINMKLFAVIKEIQNLPDDVIYKLLKVKGSLINERS